MMEKITKKSEYRFNVTQIIKVFFLFVLYFYIKQEFV